jgi:carboxyl-terminal processing protease
MRAIFRSTLFKVIIVAALLAVTLNLVLAVFRLGNGEAGEFTLVEEAYSFLDLHYIDPLPEQLQIEQGMVEGMVSALDDPYTTYVEPSAHEIQRDDLIGEYGGIGAYLAINDDGLVYLVPFEDSPAERAGVNEGDILLAVDGVVLEKGAQLDDVSAALRGPEGSIVRIGVVAPSDGSGEREYEITREVFPLQSVTSFMHPSDASVGVIVIRLFSERTPAELEKAYRELVDRGAEALILDLRNNGGGLLGSALSVAEFFLEDGVILHEQQREGDMVTHSVSSPGIGSSMPLALLVNQYTASAAEVVAGAIQDHGRAPLIGETTYGKGSVQVIVELKDGSSLHFTSARWFTPNNRTLDGVGLEPEHPIMPGDSGDAALEFALSWLSDQQ